MQFRPQGNRIQVLGYRGYDKEKKRAQVKLLGSISKSGFPHGRVASKDLWGNLTEAEKNELHVYIGALQKSHDDKMRQYGIESMAERINQVSDSLAKEQFVSHTDREFANEVYEAIDGLTKRLRKMGFRRTVKLPVETANADASGDMGTDSLL